MKGFKTILFNLLGLILVVLQYFLDTPGFLNINPTIIITAMAVVNFVLRFSTDTPVFSKDANPTRAGPGSRM